MNRRRTLKILYVVRSLSTGGAERQAIVQARGLASRGHDVTIATFYGGGALEPAARKAGVRIIEIGKSGRWNVVSFLVRLTRIVRETKPDMVHGMLVVPNIVIAALKPLLGKTRIVWGVRASNMDFARYGWLEYATFQLSRVLSRAADGIIANSSVGAAYHAKMGYPSRRMYTVLNGIDTSVFVPDRLLGMRVREELGLLPEHIVLGVAARLDPQKGFEVLLRALPAVREAYPQVRVVCVGEGREAYRQSLIQLSVELGVADIVMWVPRRDDMPAVFNAFDVGCSPSIFGEGFSNSVGEAMACGVPCVVTDVGDSAAIVGETGLVVPAGDVDALATGVSQLLGQRNDVQQVLPRGRIVQIAGLARLFDETERALLEIAR